MKFQLILIQTLNVDCLFVKNEFKPSKDYSIAF